jgi:hypothetical protein
MYEHRHQPLISHGQYIKRQLLHGLIAMGIILFSLGVGVTGYHVFERLSWIDSLLNASMILGGMGPVNVVVTTAGKVFASLYALYSGIVFLVVAGVLFAPAFHRLMHHFHWSADSDGKS